MQEWTARALNALKPRAERYVVRDPKIAGLELRVQPDGTKVWSLRYRVPGQRRRVKLGEYPRLSLANARIQANKELRKVDDGIDPQAERHAAKHAAEQAQRDTIEALAESYIECHAKPHKKSWREDQGYLRNEVLPVWKGRAVSGLTRRDCRELIQAITNRPAPVYANRILSLLSRLFRFAVEEELIPASPAVHLPKPGGEVSSRTDRPRKTYTDEEVRTIWAATEALSAPLRTQYRLGLLTGQRPGEIIGMEWAEVDGAWWTIPAVRTKNGREHRVFLTTSALDELGQVPRLDDEPRVFRGYLGIRQQSEWNAKVFAGLRRREKPRHALRDTAATGLAAGGVAVEDIARILNHNCGPKVTARYNSYGYDKEKRLALLKWERRLRAILVETQTDTATTNVVAMAARS